MKLTSEFYNLIRYPPNYNYDSRFPIPIRIREDSEYYPVSFILDEIVGSNYDRNGDIIEENSNMAEAFLNPNYYPNRRSFGITYVNWNSISRMTINGSRIEGGFNSIKYNSNNVYDYSNNVNLLLVIKKKHIPYFVSSILLATEISNSIFELWMSTKNQLEGKFLSSDNNILRTARLQNIKIVPIENFNRIFEFFELSKFESMEKMNDFLNNLVNKFVDTL